MQAIESMAGGLSIRHILMGLGVGVVAGILIVVLDQFVVSKVEAAVGLTPSTA